MLDLFLRLAYGLNIVILTPVVGSLLSHATGPTLAAFEHKVADSPGLRLLVASLWAAILLCSVAGLFQPRALVGILLLQVIYKSLYLILFVWPLIQARGWAAAPWGVTISFLFIITLWPGLIWAAWSGS